MAQPKKTYTKKQIREAISHWTAVLESMSQEAEPWKVSWRDREESGVASFKTKEDAQRWTRAREDQERLEPTGFSADPPKEAGPLAHGLWDERGDGPAKDAESFKKAACELLKASEWDIYEQFVPEKYEDFQGDRTAIDSWDEWKVNRQDTVSREEFWARLYDECANDDRILDGIPLEEFKAAFEEDAQKVAGEAWAEYEPDEGVDILVRRGRREH